MKTRIELYDETPIEIVPAVYFAFLCCRFKGLFMKAGKREVQNMSFAF